jgi:hypothetical protein
LKVAIWRL